MILFGMFASGWKYQALHDWMLTGITDPIERINFTLNAVSMTATTRKRFFRYNAYTWNTFGLRKWSFRRCILWLSVRYVELENLAEKSLCCLDTQKTYFVTQIGGLDTHDVIQKINFIYFVNVSNLTCSLNCQGQKTFVGFRLRPEMFFQLLMLAWDVHTAGMILSNCRWSIKYFNSKVSSTNAETQCPSIPQPPPQSSLVGYSLFSYCYFDLSDACLNHKTFQDITILNHETAVFCWPI